MRSAAPPHPAGRPAHFPPRFIIDLGIKISNTPGAVDHGTATVALFLIISALRQFWNAQLRAHEGKFKQGTSPATQEDPENKTLGIVGMGGIGRVSRRLGGVHRRSLTYCRPLDRPLPSVPSVLT